MSSNRQRWWYYLRFVRTLEAYGGSGVIWRAFMSTEVYDWWQDGLVTTYEAVLLYWHVGLSD
jgi:hypothetical protein